MSRMPHFSDSNVPVEESAHQWETVFTRLAEGKTVNINEIPLSADPVEGIPPSVSDLNGHFEASQLAENVLPGPEEKPPIPEAYKETVNVGSSEGVDEMGRKKSSSGHRRSRKHSHRKSSSSSSKRRSSSGGVSKKSKRRKRSGKRPSLKRS